MKESVITGSKIGTLIGAVAFALMGVLPGVYAGGYGALAVLHKLVGGVESSALAATVTIIGMIIGVICVATSSLIVGGLFGALLGFIVSKPRG
jgi:hypothetical protein